MSVTLHRPGYDLAPLAAIHAACFAQAWDVQALSELLVAAGAFCLSGGEGFILARAAGGESEILTLAVSPSARRRGTASELVAAAADHARRLGAQSMFLEVAVGNLAARALYGKLGFAEAGRRKGYYAGSPPEDALILRSDLPLSGLGYCPATG
ncbi:MAG TPA: GNAT family N-acetyltransferase [Rhizomicrobium sp.]|nr:GNAT family N-acetyltransferase [Rhizomicrobium sp.]